jgi:hypothetical protein
MPEAPAGRAEAPNVLAGWLRRAVLLGGPRRPAMPAAAGAAAARRLAGLVSVVRPQPAAAASSGSVGADDEYSYHAGELAVQARAGRTVDAAGMRKGIVDRAGKVPAYRLGLINAQRCAFVATVDADGQPHASLLEGSVSITLPPLEAGGGFVCPQFLQNTTAASPSQSSGETPCAVIAIDFDSRMRFRTQGVLATAAAAPSGGGGSVLELQTVEAFPNCSAFIPRLRVAEPLPQYPSESETTPLTFSALETTHLTQEHAELVRGACSFFVASSDGGARADISHRGGRPGFVRAELDSNSNWNSDSVRSTLRWPDFPGNGSFMTLGNINITSHPRVVFFAFRVPTWWPEPTDHGPC